MILVRVYNHSKKEETSIGSFCFQFQVHVVPWVTPALLCSMSIPQSPVTKLLLTPFSQRPLCAH